jgi:diguanylate cyclase (GGDEF)-like protein/PAS domain S-box-containing protein
MAGHDDMRQTSNGVWEPTTRTRRQPPSNSARVALEHLSARRAAKHASAVIASIQDGLVTVDEGGRIVDVNAVLCHMTGFHRLRLLGSRAPYPFWAHADAERNARTIAELLKGEFAEGGSCQLTFCRTGGERFQASVAIAPLRDADGISIGFAATVRELVDTPTVPEHDTTVAGLLRCEAAMERVAAAVSAEVPESNVYQLIAEEAALLVGADAARIARIDEGSATMMGAWAKPGFDPRQSGGTALSADVRFGSRRWGLLQTNTAARRPTRPEAQEELTCFATLATLALAIGTMDERSRTAPPCDPLTGFAGRDELERRVAAEVAVARAGEGNVAFIAIELDQFHNVDTDAGSELDEHTVLQVADRLGRVIRSGDTLGRLRAGAFGWVLPGADASGARDAAGRALAAIAHIETHGEPPIAVTVGVSDLAGGGSDAHDLVRHAEIELNDAKRGGATHFPERGNEAPVKRDRAALQILARVVESQDPAARGSAERVSELAELLALELGWSGGRAALLGEAAYVRDIGKIGLAGSLLLKPGQLSADERETMKRHVTLSAEIIDGILTPEQVEWVRHHHERFDGAGHPDGLSGDRIPEGARILGLADAWDAMTNDRCYQGAMPVADALVDCVLESGWQFCPVAVDALRGLVSAGAAAITCPDRSLSQAQPTPTPG